MATTGTSTSSVLAMFRVVVLESGSGLMRMLMKKIPDRTR